MTGMAAGAAQLWASLTGLIWTSRFFGTDVGFRPFIKDPDDKGFTCEFIGIFRDRYRP